MTGLSTWALMLHPASAALAVQCGFVREIAAALTAAKTVDENALLVDALRFFGRADEQLQPPLVQVFVRCL